MRVVVPGRGVEPMQDRPDSERAYAPPVPLDEALAEPPVAWRAPRPGLWRRVAIALFLLGALGFMAANLLHPGRAQRLTRLSASKARLESTMLALEHDNARLTAELKSLERGAEGWQGLARKEYGLLLPGEVVYRFPAERL